MPGEVKRCPLRTFPDHVLVHDLSALLRRQLLHLLRAQLTVADQLEGAIRVILALLVVAAPLLIIAAVAAEIGRAHV